MIKTLSILALLSIVLLAGCVETPADRMTEGESLMDTLEDFIHTHARLKEISRRSGIPTVAEGLGRQPNPFLNYNESK